MATPGSNPTAQDEKVDTLAETNVPASPQPNPKDKNVRANTEANSMDATYIGDDPQDSDSASSSKPASKSSSKSVSSQAGADPAKKKRRTSQLGDFKLIKKLGQGGMGEVYLATQVSLDRKVALKTLSKELAKKEDFVKRFIREARSMAKLQHPNVVQVYAADSFKGVHYVAIEFIDGQSMQDWMDDKKQLSVGDALHVILVCAEALKHAHDQSMIHRDIKPDNILVTKQGVVKVADFGLAKALDEDVSMTQSGTGLGTPLYMPPEQARNAKHVDHRTDIYALGCTLYYFLTGQLPFTGENTLELITAKERGSFTSARKLNSKIPERLDLMIDKMIAKDPSHRYNDCADIINDLGGLNLDSATPTFVEGAVPMTRRSGPVRASAPQVTIKRSGPPISSSDDAAKAEEKALQAENKTWYVRYVNAQGKPTMSKMTTQQVLQAVRNDVLDLKAKAKHGTKGSFMPLAQFPEFAKVMSGLAVKAKADAQNRDVKSVYAKLDKQERSRKRWRWVKNLFSGVKGGIGLIIWLAMIAAAGYGAYMLYQNQDQVKKLLGIE